MKKIYLFLLLTIVGYVGFGQTAASYSFNAFSSTYSSISGTSGATASPGSFACDDCAWGSASIGFNFVYCGTTYTTLAANSNGYLSLANSTTGGWPTYVNVTSSMSSISSGVGMLMCFWDDNDGRYGGRAYYVTTGSAPNRVFTFEWKAWGRCCSSGYGADNYQVKLYETTNVIEFWYGTHSISSTSATIGIANSASDYQTLSNNSSSPGRSSSTFYTSISSLPANGQVYQWSPNCMTLAPTNDGPACVGSTVNFSGTVTAGTATGYSWSGPGGFSSTLQNPSITGITAAQAGTYTFTATNSTCRDSAVTTVVVDTLPVATISGTGGVCSGGSRTVTFSGTAGATVYYNINGGSTLSVTIGGGGTATISTGTLTTGTTSTTYTYTLLSATAAGCTATLTGSCVVTCNPVPSNIAGPTAVCIGQSITLTDADAGGTWTTASTSIATASGTGTSGTVTGIAAGTAVITYAFSTGCYVTFNVTVNSGPTAISGPRSVCPMQTITVTGTPSGGTWTSGTTSVATVVSSTGVITGVATGTTFITYTMGSTGCFIIDTTTVNPMPSAFTGPTAVCVGSSITLGSTPSGGTWASGTSSIATVVGSTGVVTGASSGGVVITYTAPGGCFRTQGITVNALPSAITGTFSVCEGGNTANLYDATGGGTWSSSNTARATINSSGVVTGISRGTLTITYTVGSTGCYITAGMTVNQLPSIITGPSVVCQASTATYSDSVSGGTWSSSNSGVATINTSTGVVTGVSGGTATLTYFLSSGCTVFKTITVNPLPANITGTTSVCEGGSVTYLYDATGGGNWSSGNTSLATVDASGVVTGVSAGAVNISYVLTATGCGVSTVVTVNPLPAPIGGPTAVCMGLTINLTDASGGGSWTSNTTSVGTITSGGVVTGVSSGTTVITYTLPTGCINTSTVTGNSLPSTISGVAAICAGLNSTFSNTVSGGTWSSGNSSIATVSISGLVTGVAAGTTDITYMLGTGCLVNQSLIVNPLPAAISGAFDVCHTFTTTFSDATGGGTWASGNSSIATISGTGVITGVSVGSTTITYTLGTGCLQTQAITVDPLPVSIAGPTAVCVNSTVSLTDATGGGSWSSNNTSIASVDAASGVVTGVSAGGAVITYMLPGGCYITMNMTVNPLPSSITGTASVCEGGTVTLSNPSGTGTWTSSSTSLATVGSTTGVVTGVSAGTLNITFTLGTSCAISRVFVVNPTPTAITGTTSVCEAGSTTVLANSLPGGSWTSSNTTIATATATTTTTGTITGVAAGTATITYTVGTCYNTTSLTVNPLPGAVLTPLGDTMLCPGGFVVLTASYGTGYTYQWYTGASPISGETDDYYMATTGASYHVAITNSNGCRALSPSMAVSINPATATVAAAGATTVCSGASATLNANTGSGLTYQWMLGGAGITGATGSVYYATASGSYNVIVSNAAGCSATSTSIPVTILAAPSSSIVATGSLTFCNGGSVIITATAGSGYTYQWQLGGTNITGATDINYTATTSGNYQVVVTNSYPCSSTSTVATVNAMPLPSANVTTSGPSTFCTGGSVPLSVPAVGGSTYQWYKNGTAITGAVAPNYNATTGGNYTAHVIASTGCTATTTPAFQVSELTVPVIIPLTSTQFCWGGHAVLSVSVSLSTGITYQWQLGGVDILGATNNTYSANTSGNYSCVVTITAGGCSSSSSTITLVQYPLPNPIITFDGYTLNVQGYYTSYQWFRNFNPIAGVGPSINPEQLGDYTVRVIDSNGCQSVSTGYIVTKIGSARVLGVGSVSAEDISIFPNPSQNIVHIVASQPLNAVIHAVDGRKVMEQNDATELNISQLANGVYTLMLYNKEGQMVKVEKLTKN